MSTLFLIRHAESQANKDRILGSRLPVPLTPAGKADADLIASQLKELTELDRIISSPVRRALETADSFRVVFNLPVREDERLSEQELGDFSGVSYDDLDSLEGYEPDTMARWNWVPRGGGESYSMIADRVTSFFSSLEAFPPDEKILIVTHAVTFRLIRAFLENTLPRYPKHFPNNGEIWKVEYPGTGRPCRIESLFLGNSRDFIHNP